MKNNNPKICKLLDELSELQTESQLRANDIRRDGEIVTSEMRAYSQGTADTYAYCMMKIRDLDIRRK